MSRNRAMRRHEAAKAKRRARNLVVRIWGGLAAKMAENPRYIGHMASTHNKPCSCRGCGNRRPHEGPTVQERVDDIAMWARQTVEKSTFVDKPGQPWPPPLSAEESSQCIAAMSEICRVEVPRLVAEIYRLRGWVQP